MKLYTPKEIALQLANRVRAARTGKGMTQQEISERTGVSYSSYRRFERSGEISLVSLLKVAQVLDLDSQFDSLFVSKGFRSLDEIERSQQRSSRTRAR
ncbi:helix-turn-helix domain-containing protein [Coraliomargarita akajimensis]|uniref:Helix-turn-helix domain protein n=1 Tax=Coraliomargarita akajimensis (strain DSM 45221 / IAM 15411 / JCM 23193 / KCTC 12865 / 04OKA010-24) TaxID=583355 RepID=D5EIQ1_CORAD|nr:helix-turn-helix domain protein [Coraliomargarita akajimensis DSM 45221]